MRMAGCSGCVGRITFVHVIFPLLIVEAGVVLGQESSYLLVGQLGFAHPESLFHFGFVLRSIVAIGLGSYPWQTCRQEHAQRLLSHRELLRLLSFRESVQPMQRGSL